MKNKKNVYAIYNIHLLPGLEVVACLLTSRPLRRLPLLFAGAVAILLAVFAFLSLLSPPITNHQLYHTNRHSVSILPFYFLVLFLRRFSLFIVMVLFLRRF